MVLQVEFQPVNWTLLLDLGSALEFICLTGNDSADQIGKMTMSWSLVSNVFEREFRCERVVSSRAVRHRLFFWKISFTQSCFSQITCQSKKQLSFNIVSLARSYPIENYANNREQCNDVRHVNEDQWNNTRRSFVHRGIGKSADVRRRSLRGRVSVHGEKTRLTDTFTSVRGRNLWTMCRS